MAYRAFDKSWFFKHQSKLLWLLNAPILKYWARWVLRIHNDIPFSKVIFAVGPNRVAYDFRLEGGKYRYTVDFRTHWKFSKRLYFAFRPLWWLMHFWDWLVADRFLPQWSFGFGTLTAYPDAGNPGTTTVDGLVGRQGVNDNGWSTIITGAGNFNSNPPEDAFVRIISQSTSGYWGTVNRARFGFDTSSIPDTDNIDSATFSFYGTYKNDGGSIALDSNIYGGSSFGSNTTLANADYENSGSTAWSTAISYASWSTTGYNNFALNSTGLSGISKTGVTNIVARNANYDVAATSPTWWAGDGGNPSTWSYLQGYYADQTGTTQDPKLVVNYSTPTANISKLLLLGVG